ncbi:glutamyl-tRNA amidotransferase [Solemya velum gill symbiont]|uniref:GatB/YqeY domain-containing protein n=1 Tax=Solemya velum gill symbiont TaxID=2340 RepID=UPI00099735A9|nr:GatB/YqeY domain-containing protein [Solemya velum gill symbiont]OOZ17754.1 glutamyl-tRNA amidotransferase [Solemya velum gill symbiont]OOZ27323.1 glutamyl-tRNA amidotransferase [Solemya velum gill symbiont]
MLKQQLTDDMKAAMKGGDKSRLGVIRLILAAVKQVEVDTREELSDADITGVLTKMVKQRRDSVTQYTDAGRTELADQETYEIGIIEGYLPEQMSEDEVAAVIDEIIAATGANGPKDMGKVMGQLKGKLQGKADMGAASALVKQKLTG